MKIDDIKKKARKLGIKPGKIKKSELIKAIQRAEGNSDCFGTNPYSCNQFNCCWRDNCLKTK
jgi:hypothetical protein